MKSNFDVNQILLAQELGLIPKHSDFKLNSDLIQQVARLKIKDFDTWVKFTSDKKTGLWKQYTRIAALNLLKYKDSEGYNKDFNESFIYILGDRKFKNHYKIGRTIEPERRLSECNVYSPYKSFYLVSWIFSDEAIKKEKLFHSIYDEDNIEGEWFYFPDVEIIRNIMHSELNKFIPPHEYSDYLVE